MKPQIVKEDVAAKFYHDAARQLTEIAVGDGKSFDQRTLGLLRDALALEERAQLIAANADVKPVPTHAEWVDRVCDFADEGVEIAHSFKRQFDEAEPESKVGMVVDYLVQMEERLALHFHTSYRNDPPPPNPREQTND